MFVRFKWALIAVVAFALTWVAWGQARALLAYRRLNDVDWFSHARTEELRETALQVLQSRFADPHDAFLLLERYGDPSSIPALRAALARRPQGDLSCTWKHAQDALDRIVSEMDTVDR